MTHLMEPDPFTPAGAVRSAMHSIVQAPERTGRTDMVHRRPPFRARWLRYAPPLRSGRPQREPCLASRREKTVRWAIIKGRWYQSTLLQHFQTIDAVRVKGDGALDRDRLVERVLIGPGGIHCYLAANLKRKIGRVPLERAIGRMIG